MIDCDVLITCYKKEEFLDECINSVLRQTKQPRSIVLVHDQCPEPKSHALADTLILRDHVGVAKARDEAFRFSSSSLILFLDGDDVLSPDYLEKMVLVISDGADIAYPDTFIWDWQGGNSSLYVTPDVFNASFVKEHQKPTLPVTCLMKRFVYEELKGFREFPVFEDIDFFLRAMCNDYTFRKAQTLLWYRQSQGSRNQVEERVKAQVKKEIMDQFEITEEVVKYAKNIR